MKTIAYKEIECLEALAQCESFEHLAFQGINFNRMPNRFNTFRFTDCIFMGCIITPEIKNMMDEDCLVFPRLGTPFKSYPNHLYSANELYRGYDPDNEYSFASCYDSRVYEHYINCGKESSNIRETLARSLHDHSITDAVRDFLSGYDERDVMAVMGGHAMSRTDSSYRDVALISKRLTEKGKLMVSGGGPGAMEATHFGAWMAGRTTEEFDDALSMISAAPTFRDPHWLSLAFKVIRKYPQNKYFSLGVPTWFYGHEPAAAFATHIAKYFDNSIREDGILTIAKGGIIYSPGSAGTLQEIFQDAAQNHYETFGYASPMVFFGKEYYTKVIPVYPLMQDLMAREKYKNLILSITDDVDEVVTILS